MTVSPAWEAAFLAVYFLVSGALFCYGMHAYFLMARYRRVRDRAPTPPSGHSLPIVTVQLPLYNERYVAERLLDAAARLDYPRDRLQIQVLDDSTDDTRDRVAARVERMREAGLEVEHRRRAVRTGFKGGALREGLSAARGDLIAIFDADFLPPRGFLREVVPHFADPRIGMVQARWTHLNEDYSLLTRVQAAALDGHFLIEHVVRNRSGAFINFNGTAGVWRAACIRGAGNWQDDTLTEDLDLSYRAQLAGWRFRFLPEVPCPAELPAEMNGLKAQQFRWAKGSVQTARKLFPRVLAAPLPPLTRLQAVIHLTNHAAYPLLLLLGLCSLPALWLLDHDPGAGRALRLASGLVVASFGHPWLYFQAQRLQGRSRREALSRVPLVVAGNLGVALNNTRAVIEGLLGRSSAFHRTPKYGLRTRADGWDGKDYRVPPGFWPALELAFAAYCAAGLVYALLHGHYLAAPFLALYTLGAGAFGWGSLRGTRGVGRAGKLFPEFGSISSTAVVE